MDDDLAKAAYFGCFTRYGNPITQQFEKAWQWQSEEQKEMWRDVAAQVVKAYEDRGVAAPEAPVLLTRP